MTLTNFSYPYPHPAIAADIVMLALQGEGLSVLLIERGEAPFKGQWALPGGFLRPDETIDACAARELREETGVSGSLHLVGVFSTPDRDPRERVVSIAYVACVDHRATRIRADTDASDARWWPVHALPSLAFDHSEILHSARIKAATLTRETPLAAELLPPTFTLAELQFAEEALLGRKLDKRNFRKDVLASGDYVNTGEVRRGQHRPAEVWRVG